ncbi:MAG: hypothetical protein KR126chlam4_01304 [Candidatus Anoxychlamydiales bacterium]|nr:hypothetical protein [Candidatus Anoxychlamydiales bacterium]HEU64528.1 hypothetical protein [Chlamydiota bacterium]
MRVDRSIVFMGIESVAKWPFQNEDNFYSSAFATIAFLASQRFFNVSYTFSLILSTTVLFTSRIYQRFQVPKRKEHQEISIDKKHENNQEIKFILDKKITENIRIIRSVVRIIEQAFQVDKRKKDLQIREENIKEMNFFLIKDLHDMTNVIRGDALDEKKEKIKVDEFSKQKEKFIRLCNYFNLEFMTFYDIWKKYPSATEQEFVSDCKKRGDVFLGNIYLKKN